METIKDRAENLFDDVSPDCNHHYLHKKLVQLWALALEMEDGQITSMVRGQMKNMPNSVHPKFYLVAQFNELYKEIMRRT